MLHKFDFLKIYTKYMLLVPRNRSILYSVSKYQKCNQVYSFPQFSKCVLLYNIFTVTFLQML